MRTMSGTFSPPSSPALLVTQTVDRSYHGLPAPGLAHRALTMHPVAAAPCRFVIWITTGMRPASGLRCTASTTPRPTPPKIRTARSVVGFWRVQLGNVGALQARSRRSARTAGKYAARHPARPARQIVLRLRARRARDRHRDPRRRHGLLGFGLRSASSRPGCTRCSTSCCRARSTRSGTRSASSPTTTRATNVQSLALMTAGEGLHNNHHAAPTSATFALQAGRDRSGLVVRADCWCSSASHASATTSCKLKSDARLTGVTQSQGSGAITSRSWSGPRTARAPVS